MFNKVIDFFKKSKYDNKSVSGFYDEDVWTTTAQELYPFLDQGMTIYYEIVGFTSTGSAIQKDYDYGCKGNKKEVYIYRITSTTPNGKVRELSAKQVQDWCKLQGFKAVPEYYYGYAKDLFSELPVQEHWDENFLEALREEYLEKDCSLCASKVPDEGIVLRIENDEPEAFKLKSFRFLQKETKDLDKGVISLEDEN